MTKFIVDLWLDGYDSEEESNNACEQFIYDSLDTASSVKVTKIVDKDPDVNIECKIDPKLTKLMAKSAGWKDWTNDDNWIHPYEKERGYLTLNDLSKFVESVVYECILVVDGDNRNKIIQHFKM